MPEKYMQIAILEARNSKEEIPVGCVIEKNGKILAKTHNLKEKTNDITAHAEILALKEASDKLCSWRLSGCNLYVTLEPCPMCAWAILTSGIENVYFGSYDLNYGAMGSKLNFPVQFNFKKTKIYGGIMEEDTGKILSEYFLRLRLKAGKRNN